MNKYTDAEQIRKTREAIELLADVASDLDVISDSAERQLVDREILTANVAILRAAATVANLALPEPERMHL